MGEQDQDKTVQFEGEDNRGQFDFFSELEGDLVLGSGSRVRGDVSLALPLPSSRDDDNDGRC